LACRVALSAQVVDILIANASFLHPIQQPLQPGVDAISGLMGAIIGITAKEMIELCRLFMHAHSVVELGHGKLVLIGKQYAFSHKAIGWFHVRYFLYIK
jgi:hypothetical protein